jgi:uncharacterized RDD family membrane protein YckC
MNNTCPTCGATDYGTPFCVSCQAPMAGKLAVAPDTGDALMSPQLPGARAGFFRRFSAFALDWLVLSIIADIIRFAYRFGSGKDPGMVHLDTALILSTALFILYFTLLTGEGGQTLGKKLLDIKVQNVDGSNIGYGRSLMRALGYTVSVFFMTFLGFLWALWDKNNQAWHDKIAGTIVVKT